MREREGLIARVKQMRRASAADDRPGVGVPAANPGSPPGPGAAEIQALAARVAHLERLVEGLQDSVHRESERHDRRITEVEARLEPGALAVALSEDARQRGL